MFLLKNKYETIETIHEFVKKTKLCAGHPIQIIRNDNETEFINSKVRNIIDNGMQYQPSVGRNRNEGNRRSYKNHDIKK